MVKRHKNKHRNTIKYILTLTLLVITNLTFGQSNSEKDTLISNPNYDKTVREDKNMYEASIANGFYDQAHLSNAFRQMLGISPSDVYNSRMLQV